MKIFVESSIFVEYIKGNQTELLEYLITSEHELFTNTIVHSEFMFYYLAVIGEKSPLALKESKQIKKILEHHNPIEMFEYFTTLSIDRETELLSYNYMKKYNLLPNDALILATAKLGGMEILASFDKKDFQKPCKSENIKLITSISELE